MKVGQLRSNKPATLYSTDSFVVSCCANPEGSAIISGLQCHDDAFKETTSPPPDGGGKRPNVLEWEYVDDKICIATGSSRRTAMWACE